MSLKINFGTTSPFSLTAPTMGSERAMKCTAKALAMRGHEVDITPLIHYAPSLRYDIFHWWNSGGHKGPYLLYTKLAKLAKIPVCATPIYWPTNIYLMRRLYEDGMSHEGTLAYLQASEQSSSILGETLAQCTMIFPNSAREADEVAALIRAASENPPPMHIVPNAVDLEELARVTPTPWEKRSLIVSVGRLELAKGQHILAEVFPRIRKKIPEARLVLVGEVLDTYLAQFKKILFQRNVELTGTLPPSEVLELLGQARVHALLATRDTPGLANLEAAALGARLLVSYPPGGTFRDYWPKSWLTEVNPCDRDDVFQGLFEAWDTPPPRGMAEFTKENFNYGRVAELLERYYVQMLEGRKDDE